MNEADERAWLADEFERQRSHLQGVAYRMLGSVTEAEDAVQEAWLRLARSDADTIDNLAGWLTTVVGRVCLDMLRTRKSRREQHAGITLPEPIVADLEQPGPEDEAILADSVGLALLVVLDTLTPAERLAFVLHDMFAVPFEEIAPVLDKSPMAARQLASRARRRVRGADVAPQRDAVRQRQVVTAFLAAARAGKFEALVDLLHPDVVFRVDAGRISRPVPPLTVGSLAVATEAARQGPRFATLCSVATVNGAAGIVARTRRGLVGVAAMTVVDGLITEIDLVLDPDKLS